jgi:hypothetical protein
MKMQGIFQMLLFRGGVLFLSTLVCRPLTERPPSNAPDFFCLGAHPIRRIVALVQRTSSLDTHIGTAENYLWCSLQLKMNGTNSELPPSEPIELWFIGQHETSRTTPNGPSRVLREAQDVGYDMLTAPISTPDFQSKVVDQVEQHLEKLSNSDAPSTIPMPLLSPLTPKDTTLTPDDSNSALIAVVSSWIDLGSLDPLIANVSLQVFNLEMAYAAFCGIQHVMLHGPLPGSNVIQYARAVSESFGMGPYIHLNVLLPMVGELEHESGDGTHLAELAKEQEVALPEEDDPSEDVFGSWDTWDTLRTMCNYDSRLSVGKQKFMLRFSSSMVLLLSYHFFMELPLAIIGRLVFTKHDVKTSTSIWKR